MLEFGSWGCWILDLGDFGFWILEILGSPGDLTLGNLVTVPGGQRLESSLVCLSKPPQNQLYLIELEQERKLSFRKERRRKQRLYVTQFGQTYMNLHGTFMALSPCHSHGTFVSLSWQIRTWPQRKAPEKCTESAMKISWNCLGSHVRGCRQSAMNLPWICYALSWHFQPNRARNSFMPFSWRMNGIFMALSPKNYFKIVISVLSCLCLSICRQCFSSFDIMFIDAFSSWSKLLWFSLI